MRCRPKNEMPVIFVRHAGHEFTLDEMTLAGEKHKRDVSLFFAMGPDALDRISLPDPDRVFAMLWCYYNCPALRAHIQEAVPV